MAYEIIIRPTARNNVDDTIQWYEEQQTGLGIKFYRQFLDGIEKIKTNPTYFTFIYEEFRRINLKSFPYNIIYKVIDDVVVVFTIYHHSRDPVEMLKRKY